MYEQRKIRILVADDHVLIREGLKQILLQTPDIEVVAEAAQLSEIPQAISKSHPLDVLLLDLSFPDGNALTIMPDLKKLFPDRPKILILTVHSSAQYAAQCFSAGAHGFVQKEASPKELFCAIHRVHAGQIYDELGEYEQYGNHTSKNEKNSKSLSRREKEVLVQLAEGKSTIQISKSLGLSPNTVKTYRSRLLDKMGFRNEAEIIRYALIHNLFT